MNIWQYYYSIFFFKGTGTGSTSAGNVNGGQLLRRANKTKLDKGAEMMKALRNVTSHALERNRNKSASLLLPASTSIENSDNENSDYENEKNSDEENEKEEMEVEDDNASLFSTTSLIVTGGTRKGHVSLREKRRLKKKGLRGEEIRRLLALQRNQQQQNELQQQQANEHVSFHSSNNVNNNNSNNNGRKKENYNLVEMSLKFFSPGKMLLRTQSII